MDFLGLGVALHPQFAPVGGGDGHVEHLDLVEPLQHAARTQACSRLLVVLLEGDVEAVGEEADEDVSLDAAVELMEDGTQAEVAFEGAEAFFDAHEVDVVAPEFGGVFAGEVAAEKILAFVAAGGFEFFAIQLNAKGVGADGFSAGGKVEDDEAVGVASGFLLGGSDGQEEFVAGEFFPLLEFFEAGPVGFELFAPHGAFLATARQAAGEE